MTKVWVVTHNDWETHSIAGVFTDEAAAQDLRDRLDATLGTRDILGLPSYDVDALELDQPASWATGELARKGPPPK
jgi:hypothetical protein